MERNLAVGEKCVEDEGDWKNRKLLRFFEALAIELQRPTVFRDRADNILWSTRRHVSFNLNGDLHLRIEQTGKMLNHGSGYRINVS